ncbi:CopA family copper-resistance protein [Algoriphagus sp. 4150]|uniref:multicopper oxidase domain-containing protein n=1 Tax=Algoriphagus sp. 4150 TaxID=2817756 RepID=UPI002862A372|nr:multicopper oxidase domain-containing protein [Algoriphagus sp. 4150]MDR7130637.1 CopA family copper-resistance protein [Algoriphagus sp. 4150]
MSKLSIKILAFSILSILLSAPVVAQKLVEYDLYVRDTLVNYTGKTKKAISVNGQTPMPTLHFTEGDTAVIRVHNKMHHTTSLHWHGLILPNEQDGVPYLTTAPIEPHSTHTFEFVLKQSGTYWYHSHTMLQEQIGMYGALIIHKKNEQPENEEVLLLTDWSDENPHQIERSLHFATDWYMIKKNSVQSYSEAIKAGKLKTKLTNEWKRMHAMDVSDVYYEQFQINGQTSIERKQYKPGEKVRLRVINGSASTYFWLSYAGGKFKVIASDGMDVEPVEVDRLIVGVSEIYDLEVTVPESGEMAEFLATSEDRMGYASFWLGNGPKLSAQKLPQLDYFEGMDMMNSMMTLGGKMDDMGMDMALQKMDMNAVMYRELTDDSAPTSEDSASMDHSQMDHSKMNSEDMEAMHAKSPAELVTLNYNMLKAPRKTTLPDVPTRTLNFELTGNMNRYVWTLDNKTISESDKILIKKGENVRIVLTNNSMMRHPMHLHGHFFRVVNDMDEYAPLKNVLDIMPMETDTIEFHASEEYGDWFFHCHILYHMMAGMGRIISYEDSPPNPQIGDPRVALRKVKADDRRFYLGAEVGVETNGTDGDITLMNTRWMLQTEWRVGLNARNGYETESHFGRFLGRNQFAFGYVGWDFRYREGKELEKSVFGQANTKDDRNVFHLGFQYTAPWFIVTDLKVDHTGYVRLQLRRDDIPLTKRARLWGMVNSDLEYAVGARYILTKYISASSHYDSDMGLGAGITFTY